MNCDEVRNEQPALLYGELEPGVREAVERHLVSCSACRAERDAHLRTMRLLNQWPEAEPPAAAASPVPREVSHALPPAGIFRFLRPIAFGAAAAAVLFGVLVLVGGEVRYAEGRLVVALGGGPGPDGQPATWVPAAQVRELAGTECDRRIEGLLGLLREEFDEFNRRQERNRLLLAGAVDVQREQDRRLQWAALQALARGLGEDSAKQQRAIGELYSMIGSGEVNPASYIEPQRRD